MKPYRLVVASIAIIGLTVGASAITATVAAATSCTSSRYVSAGGNDANSGSSSSSAWKSLAKISTATITPGTCIQLQGGTTFSGTLSLGADDANNPARPVTITSYGTGRATIASGTAKGISIYNTGGVSISKVTVKGSGATSNTSSGIEIYTDMPAAKKYSGISVSAVDVSGYRQSGILVGASPSDGSKSGFVNVTISSSTTHSNGDAGLQTYGAFSATSQSYAHRNIKISNVYAFDNAGISGKGNNSGSGIVVSDVDGALIEKSRAYNNGARNDYAGGGPVGIWAWDANNVTIEHNESYANKTQTGDGDGFDLDGGVTNSVMQYNTSHDNYGAGYLVYQFSGARTQSNNVVRYNASTNDSRKNQMGGIVTGAAEGTVATNISIHDNTISLTPAARVTPAGMRFWEGSRNVSVTNNTVQLTGSLPVVSVEKATTVAFANNTWSGSGSFFAYMGGSDFSDTAATKVMSLNGWAKAKASTT